MTQASYLIPSQTHQVEDTIKNSRFITKVFKLGDINELTTQAEVKHHLTQLKQQYPDARHHCYAFVAGSPSQHSLMGFSDDGEPSGTAGKPMLAVLNGSGIGHILIVCIRYFGGVKLGTGGLVKAYSGGVKLALASLPTQTYTIKQNYTLTCEYRHHDQINYWLLQANADTLDTIFNDKIQLKIAVAEINRTRLQKLLAERQIDLKKLDT